MIPEHRLVPFSSADLPPGPHLVFSPHPDDEVFGMGGTLALAARAGIDVQVVTLTDGALGGDAAVRRTESQNAARVLGILPPLFWDLPDRSLTDSGVPGDRVGRIVAEFSPGCVFLPAFQEVHPDHRAAARFISQALWEIPGNFEVWLYEINRQGEINRLVDTSGVMDVKINAMHAHASQLDLFDYEDVTVALDRARAITLGKGVKYAEGFFALGPHRDTAAVDTYLEAVNLIFFHPAKGEGETIAALQARLAAAEDRATVLEARLRAMENSASWRVTAPLRRAKDLISRGRIGREKTGSRKTAGR